MLPLLHVQATFRVHVLGLVLDRTDVDRVADAGRNTARCTIPGEDSPGEKRLFRSHSGVIIMSKKLDLRQHVRSVLIAQIGSSKRKYLISGRLIPNLIPQSGLSDIGEKSGNLL